MTSRFAPTQPVLGLLIDPGDDTATVVSVLANAPGEIARVVGGAIEAVEVAGGSVLWLDEYGKNNGLATNLLATKIAHRLHAGLYPDDTVNGRALVLGEVEAEHGPVCADLTPATFAALGEAGVEVVAQASQEVLIVAGGPWVSSLYHYNSGGGCMVTTQQIDDQVFVVGQDDYTIGVYPVAAWLGEEDAEPDGIEATSPHDAWELLRHLRSDSLVHQCDSCAGWLFASDRSMVGQLRCGACGVSAS